ncbi:MAG: hypothetical protein PHC50_06300 [Candidatus Cloacimonetes bacterium]|nr:hypothetical protein [Candidatus Cloacimonadota bacterium]
MINEKIEGFLEKVNMNYLFCLLSNLEAQRINQFPTHVKQKFEKKITSLAMEHVADNEVPDYLAELAEAEMLAKTARAFSDGDDAADLEEETVDDSINFARNIQQSEGMETENYSEEVVEDPFAMVDDDDLDDDFDDDEDED